MEFGYWQIQHHFIVSYVVIVIIIMHVITYNVTRLVYSFKGCEGQSFSSDI